MISQLLVDEIRSMPDAHASPADCLLAIDAVEDEPCEPVDAPAAGESDDPGKSVVEARAKQIVTKLHISTGHASPDRCCAWQPDVNYWKQ